MPDVYEHIMISIYQFAVNNVREYIRGEENQKALAQMDKSMNAFDTAQVLAVAFMKRQEDVLADLIGITSGADRQRRQIDEVAKEMAKKITAQREKA
jgi:hypothetical protein